VVTLATTLLGAGETAPVQAVAARVEQGLNPFVLTTLVSSRIVVEIDWVEGYRPTEKAVDALEAVLLEHCEPGKQVDVRLDETIPRAEWSAAAGRQGLEGLVARYLDADPGEWDRAEIVYVLYAPDSRPWYEEPVSGMTDRVIFRREEAVLSVRTVLLFTDEIRHDAMLWVGASKVERSTLVHEMGHVIGLVTNPDHLQRDRPGHCNVARCVMHKPGGRAGFVNGLPALFAGRIPSRYGKRCVEDIETAKREWRRRAAASPGFVDELRTARMLHEKSATEAWRAQRRDE